MFDDSNLDRSAGRVTLIWAHCYRSNIIFIKPKKYSSYICCKSELQENLTATLRKTPVMRKKSILEFQFVVKNIPHNKENTTVQYT